MMLSSLPVYSAISSARPLSATRAHHVQRLVAIERRHLDRDHRFDVAESPPEFVRQQAAARPRAAGRSRTPESLRRPRGSAPAIRHRWRSAAPRGSAGRCRIPRPARELRFAHGLRRLAADARHLDRCAFPTGVRTRTPLRAASCSTGGRGRPADRGSRTAWCARPPRRRPRRPRNNSASAPPAGVRRASARAVSASGCAGITTPVRSACSTVASMTQNFPSDDFEVGGLVERGAAGRHPPRHHFHQLFRVTLRARPSSSRQREASLSSAAGPSVAFEAAGACRNAPRTSPPRRAR